MPRKLRVQYLRSQGFQRERLQRLEGSLGGHHAGEMHRQAAEAKAERTIVEELQRNGWCEQERQARRKNDPAKLEIAARLRQETPLSIKDIPARVPLGTSRTANLKLHDPLRRSPAYDPAQAQLAF